MYKHFQPVAILVLASLLLMSLFGCSSRHKLTTHYDIEKRALTSPESVNKLILAMDDPDEDVRANAVTYLGRIGMEAHEAVPRVLQAAENDPNESVTVRGKALIALASIHPNKDEVTEYLIEFIGSSKDAELREQAARAIKIAKRSASSFGILEIKDGPSRDIAEINITPRFVYNNGYQGNARPVSWCAVLPVQIKIKNHSPSKIRVDPKNVTMFIPKASESMIKSLSASEAAVKLEYSMEKAVTKAILLFPFSIGSPFNAARANQIVAKHTKKSILKKMEIEPHDNKEGYLYFNVPRSTRNLMGYRICLKLHDLSNNDIYEVDYTFGDTYQVSKIEGPLPVQIP